jgi:NitT/TauT family transport system substrate-binding protein
MFKIIQKSLVLVLVISCFALNTACSKKTEQVTENVTYRLKWIFNTSVVGDLYAKQHGIFADSGLNVDIKPGGPEYDAIKELELGRAQFGVASADQVIRAVAKGASVVVIAQLFQVNPLQWIYRSDNIKIETPEDLKGKIIGITYGGNDESIMRTLLAKYKITDKQVEFFSVHRDYTPFYKGKVDLWPVYRNSQGIFIGKKLTTAGENISFLNPDAFGIQFVANSVITSKQMLEKRPQTVKKFITALVRAWDQAIDIQNHEKAVQTIHKFNENTEPEIISEQLSITRNLIKPWPEFKTGTINTQAWEQTENIMLKQKLIKKHVDMNEILKDSL